MGGYGLDSWPQLDQDLVALLATSNPICSFPTLETLIKHLQLSRKKLCQHGSYKNVCCVRRGCPRNAIWPPIITSFSSIIFGNYTALLCTYG